MNAYVTVTFSNLTPDQAQNLFASLNCDYKGPAPTVAAVESTTVAVEPTTAPADDKPDPAVTVKRRPGRPKKDETTAATPPSGDLRLPPAVTHTLNDVRSALAELSSKKGLDECRVRLGNFGVNRVGELDASKYADFIKACAV